MGLDLTMITGLLLVTLVRIGARPWPGPTVGPRRLNNKIFLICIKFLEISSSQRPARKVKEKGDRDLICSKACNNPTIGTRLSSDTGNF